MDIEKKSVSEQKDAFIREIEARIFSGKLKPGDRLPTERELAEEMGVNRSIASSGLKILADKGFIEIRPRHGMVVSDYRRSGNMNVLTALITYNNGHFDSDILDMIFEARVMHETTIARLCAKRSSEENVAELRRILSEMESAEDGRTLGLCMYSFYHEMAIASGNIVLSLSLQIFRDIYIVLSESFFNKAGTIGLSVLFENLVTQIAAHQEKKAVQSANEIIEKQKEALRENFRQGEQLES